MSAINPPGDLAQFLQSRARISSAQQDLSRLTGELSSGRRADLGQAVRGDFTSLTSVERGLRMTSAYTQAAGLAGDYFSTMQRGLETVQSEIGTLGPDLMAAAGFGLSDQMLTAAIASEASLSLSITALNTQIGGRSPFAGIATNQSALVSADDILTDLEALVAGAPDAATMITLVDDYFNDPAGGYETTAYLGDPQPQSGFTISDGETVEAGITALDPAIRKAFSGLAIGALMVRNAGPGDPASLTELSLAAGERLQEGQDALTDMRADLGVAEAQVENAMTRHRATETALGLERTRIVSADPFETATELQNVETRLETLYLLTSRLSRLSLSEYL